MLSCRKELKICHAKVQIKTNYVQCSVAVAHFIQHDNGQFKWLVCHDMDVIFQTRMALRLILFIYK